MQSTHMMIRTQVYLPEDLHRELKLLANTEKTNYSSLIREGVMAVIKKKHKPMKKDAWKKFIGAAGKVKIKGRKRMSAVELIHDYYAHDVV